MERLSSEQLREMWATLARPPKESIEIYDAVEQVLGENPGISRQEAFRRLSEATGRKLGNISTAYYRQARRLHAASSPQPPVAGGGAEASRLDDLERLAEQLRQVADELVDRVVQERRDLEQERERIERAKQAIIDA